MIMDYDNYKYNYLDKDENRKKVKEKKNIFF